MGTLSKRKRRFGDRYDGYRVSSPDPFFVVIPHIMATRNDAMVNFEEDIDIGELESFVRKMRRESDMTDLSMLHVMMAAAVRMISQHPCVNRFVAGRKIYARNHIALSIALKKEMNVESEETTIKPIFEPEATLHDVWEILHEEFSKNKQADASNDTDALAGIFSKVPGFVLKFVVFLVRKLDSVGLMPKALHKLLPFYTSVFLVDNGSLGIDSVFHHLYNFGTASIFLSIGRKRTETKMNPDGSVETQRKMRLRFVVDERICDGYYFATTIRDFRKILRHPQELLTPPETVKEDPGLRPTKAQKKHLKLLKKQKKSDLKSAKRQAKNKKRAA